MRQGRVGLVLVVPCVAQGKPINRFWIVAGFERAAQVRKVKTPPLQVQVRGQSCPVLVAVIMETRLTRRAIAPGGKDRSGIELQARPFAVARCPCRDTSKPGT